jgi:hypothetical protein
MWSANRNSCGGLVAIAMGEVEELRRWLLCPSLECSLTDERRMRMAQMMSGKSDAGRQTSNTTTRYSWSSTFLQTTFLGGDGQGCSGFTDR